MRDREPIRVVGGGISGLWAAVLLARRGRAVELVEASDRLGGLAGREEFRGLPVDLGSHRLHPGALEEPLFRELHRERPFLTRPRRGVLVLRGRHVPYPPHPLPLARALGVRACASFAAGWLASRSTGPASWQQRGDGDPERDAGFESFVRARVGDRVFDTFYRPYAEKVWGLPAGELSQTVAKKRVSTTDPLALLGRRQAFAYPPDGISWIADRLARELEERRVPVRLGEPWTPARGAPGDVLFGGRVRDLVPTALAHRGIYLVFLALPIPRLSPAETWYCPGDDLWFGRVSEIGNYSPGLRNPGETVLCVEVPEGRWGQAQDFTTPPRLAALRDQLAGAGILPRHVEPLEARQRFVPDVYPLHRRGWLAEWRATMARVEALERVLPFGRQGLFLHCNLDHCARIAGDAVEHAARGGGVGPWLRQAESYLGLQVRD